MRGPMKNKNLIRVMMLGASLSTRGGIMSVERLLLSNAGDPICYIHIPTFTLGPAYLNAWLYWSAMARLFFSCAFGLADIVHIHFCERGSTLRKLLPSLITLLFRRPLVLHSHSSNYEEFFAGLPAWAKKIVVQVFGRCSLFISLSETWDRYYKKTFGFRDDQTVILYNPVFIPKKIPDRRGRPEVSFLFLGLIGPRGGVFDKTGGMISMPRQDKGAFDLIRAFAMLPAEDRGRARLSIVGDGDVQGARDLASRCAVEDRVSVLSWLEENERDAQLDKADVFVMPSYNEGLPMSMLEAMAWGLPVLVTPVGGIPEFVTDGREGLLVFPGDVKALTQAMTRLIRDPAFRWEAGRNARPRVLPLSVGCYMNSLYSSYRALCPSGTGETVFGN
jgi:glycosyltransferase involved in cell wall biosynthesis